MKVELSDEERELILIALGMAAATAMNGGDSKEVIRGIRVLIGKLAPSPSSYWALRPEDS